MASNFPGSTDLNLFNTPVKNKQDDVHTVAAVHVNQLQDSLLAVQESLANSVTSNTWISPLIPNGTSAYDAIDLIAASTTTVGADLATHEALADDTGPAAHPAEVISFSVYGNLSATRVHWAFHELQDDIDNIMSGGAVEGGSLDDRYVMLTNASQTLTGDYVVDGDLAATGSLTVGVGASDIHTINGTATFNHGLILSANDLEIQAGARILFQDGALIESPDQKSYLKFLSDAVLFGSNKGFTFTLDTDDLLDAIAEEASFKIVNGVGGVIFEAKEDGTATFQNLSLAAGGALVHDGDIESLSKVIIAGATRYEEALISEGGVSSVVTLDAGDNAVGEFFAVTRHGDTALVETSADLFLKVKEDMILAPNHVLKPGVQEKGVAGWEFHSTAAGNVFGGMMVNFKSEMSNVPSAIAPVMIENVNAQNLVTTDITKYGFFFRFEAIAAGVCRVKFAYETVGN